MYFWLDALREKVESCDGGKERLFCVSLPFFLDFSVAKSTLEAKAIHFCPMVSGEFCISPSGFSFHKDYLDCCSLWPTEAPYQVISPIITNELRPRTTR
jgi:hypothetical protein